MQCQVEGCKTFVGNIRRHMRLCHPDLEQEPLTKKKEAIPKERVPKVWLDLHLQHIHGMDKGEQLQAVVHSSITRMADTPAMIALGNSLMDYK